MIIVKLMGGLGNQMFQYAFGQELALLYNESVCYDIDSFSKDKQRNLAISNFDIEPITDWHDLDIELDTKKKIWRKEKIYHVVQKLVRILKRDERIGQKLFYRYAKEGYYFNFDPYYYQLPIVNRNVKVAYGYFQGEEYFKHCAEKIKKQFKVRIALSLEEEKWMNQIKESNAVAVHIRAGDYHSIKNRRFDVCTIEYFENGIKYFKQHLVNPVFYIFTNDVNLVKNKYNFPDDVRFIEGMNDYQDMRLMMECRHFLISNSTFSWWASYLAAYEEKQIIVPKKWLRTQHDEFAIYNTKMIKR